MWSPHTCRKEGCGAYTPARTSEGWGQISVLCTSTGEMGAACRDAMACMSPVCLEHCIITLVLSTLLVYALSNTVVVVDTTTGFFCGTVCWS